VIFHPLIKAAKQLEDTTEATWGHSAKTWKMPRFLYLTLQKKLNNRISNDA
jgi:hypothetical protein